MKRFLKLMTLRKKLLSFGGFNNFKERYSHASSEGVAQEAMFEPLIPKVFS